MRTVAASRLRAAPSSALGTQRPSAEVCRATGPWGGQRRVRAAPLRGERPPSAGNPGRSAETRARPGRSVHVTLFAPAEDAALERQTGGEAAAGAGAELDELMGCAARRVAPPAGEQVEGNCEILSELVAASAQKGQLRRKRLSELGITQADDGLMSQEMFVAIVGNQFRWNGKGSFGTFLF